jgi:hypothetical protein
MRYAIHLSFSPRWSHTDLPMPQVTTRRFLEAHHHVELTAAAGKR